MAKGKRKVPGINASSTADISFILFIFFLITTSMDTDRGLARRLPPPPENTESQEDVIVRERNVLQVRINKDDQLMVGGEWFDIKQLKERAKEFISNPNNDENLPEKHAKQLPFFGNVMITDKHVISVQNDVGTSYDMYIQVQNELVAAYNELRNELAMSQFGKSLADCSEDEKKEAEEKALNTAKEVIAALDKGEKFEDLAKKYSKDEDTSKKGGSLGKINVGDYTSEVVDAAKELKVGTYTTTPVKSSYGYHIVYLKSQDKKPELNDDVTNKIKTIVGNEIAQEPNFYVKALKALREKNEMKFKDTTLEKEFNKLVTQYENQQQSSN